MIGNYWMRLGMTARIIKDEGFMLFDEAEAEGCGV